MLSDAGGPPPSLPAACPLIAVWLASAAAAAGVLRAAALRAQSAARPDGPAPGPAPAAGESAAGAPAPRPGSVVLISPLFGERAARSPHLPFFTRSAAACGVDVVLAGDPAPPPGVLPHAPSVRHFAVTWAELVGRIERALFGGAQLAALRAAKNYGKAIDLKPALCLALPEVCGAYEWWGWVDNDLLLGDVRGMLSADLLGAHDVLCPNAAEHPSHGPLTLLRNSGAVHDLLRRAPLPAVLAPVYNSSEVRYFDEWGAPDWAGGRGLGEAVSLSGLLRAPGAAALRQLAPGAARRALPFAWDHHCHHRPGQGQGPRGLHCVGRRCRGASAAQLKALRRPPPPWPPPRCGLCTWAPPGRRRPPCGAARPEAPCLVGRESRPPHAVRELLYCHFQGGGSPAPSCSRVQRQRLPRQPL
eukprot:TRINITY_DN19843_c0_g1_i1.p1 TRINITY_DN19843_c0_g1~~TRINITY_DN19843_c0_g1_i1.p1  ORF type:complete len:441 (+),score=99.03 TRINITY_DN19843_c0_g1_i1:78-1325(+)